MDKSLFPNGVLINQQALSRTELTKAAEILRGRVDLTSRGVLSGGTVTAATGANAGKVNVASFSGYVPNGEFVESTVSTLVTLADSTLNVVNVVCAVYTESNTHVMPHESNSLVYPTWAERSYRIAVYTQTDFDDPTVLPVTAANLATNAKDRCLILAKVTANGAGVLIPDPGNIQLPTVYSNIMYTDPVNLGTIHGVTVLSVSPTCPTGVSVLTYDSTIASPNPNFTWTSPGGVVGNVAAYADGNYQIISSGHTIDLSIIVSLLPTLGALSENITVYNLYYQEVPRTTADDWFHRNLLGTGIVTETNPHGSSIDDILGGSSLTLLDEHQDVMHANGIWRGSNPGIFLPGITVGYPNGDILSLYPPGLSDLYYVNGKKLNRLDTSSTAFYFDSTICGPASKLYEIYVTDDETTVFHKRAEYPGGRAVRGTWIVDISADHPAPGPFVLDLIVSLPLASLSWAGGTPVVFTHPSTGRANFIVRLFAENQVDWIDVFIGESGAADDQFPLASANDDITITAALDRDQNMQIYSTPYWKDPVSSKGQVGIPPNTNDRLTNVAVDKRPWGTLGKENFSDDALSTLVYKPQNDFFGSGILLNTDGDKSFYAHSNSGLTFYMNGGAYYFGGERKSIEGAIITVAASETSLVYIDKDGTFQVIQVTAPVTLPGVDTVEKAMEYVVGSCFSRNNKHVNPSNNVNDFDTNDKWKPEMGVPLYVVTSGGASIDLLNDAYCVARNIHGVEPWSVGMFSSSLEGSYNRSMFDNLKSAFLWANLYRNNLDRYDSFIEFKLTGTSYIFSQVTQPANTKVTGIHNNAYVAISAVLTSGAWDLSDGCVVDNVSLWPIATLSAGSYAFALASNVKISHCKTMDPGVLVDTNFGFIYASSATTYGGVIIEDNIIYCNKFLKSCTNASNYNIVLRNNFIVQSEAIATGAAYSLIELGGSTTNSRITVANNSIRFGVGVSSLNAISLSSGTAVFDISHNKFYIEGTSTALWGIRLTSCVDSIIKDNNFITDAASTSLYYGIYLATTVSNVMISGNKIQKPYYGISLVGRSFKGLSITNNEIIGETTWSFVSSGVSIAVTTTASSPVVLDGLLINNNRVSDVSNLLTDVYGISVVIDDSINKLTSGIRGIDINNNYLNGLTVAGSFPGADLSIYGIAIAFTGAATLPIYGLSAKGNTITGLGAVAGGTVLCFGINFSDLSGTSLTDNITISQNNIEFLSSSATQLGVGIKSSLPNTLILGNDVTTLGDDAIVIKENNTKVISNKVFSTLNGIHATDGDSFSIIDCDVTVASFVANDGTIGSCCIYVGSSSNMSKFTIKGCKTMLYGNALSGPSVLLKGSGNIIVNGVSSNCSSFSIENCETRQYHTSISAADGYHIAAFSPLGAFTIKGNVVFNDDVGVAASCSHGIYHSAVAAGNFRGNVCNNVIYGSNRNPSGATPDDSRYELKIDTYYVGMAPAPDYLHDVVIMNNGVFLNPSRAITSGVESTIPNVSLTLASSSISSGTNSMDSYSNAGTPIHTLVNF